MKKVECIPQKSTIASAMVLLASSHVFPLVICDHHMHFETQAVKRLPIYLLDCQAIKTWLMNQVKEQKELLEWVSLCGVCVCNMSPLGTRKAYFGPNRLGEDSSLLLHLPYQWGGGGAECRAQCDDIGHTVLRPALRSSSSWSTSSNSSGRGYCCCCYFSL